MLLLLAIATASAHIEITSHTPRHGRELQKIAPCGAAADARGDDVTTYAAGQTITLGWREFIDHPGHYRVAFSVDGDADFADPTSADDLYTNDAVLLDDIEDRQGGGDYEIEVTLPDLSCDRCTLQLIQVMTDKPPYGDGNDLYYACIDLVLTSGVEEPVEPERGCAVSPWGPAGGGSSAVALLAFLVTRRHRRTNAHVPRIDASRAV